MPSKPLPGPYDLDPFQSDVVKLQWGTGSPGGSWLTDFTFIDTVPFNRYWGVQTQLGACDILTDTPGSTWRSSFGWPVGTEPAGVTHGDLMAATYLGLTSGFAWIPESVAPDYLCGVFAEPTPPFAYNTGGTPIPFLNGLRWPELVSSDKNNNAAIPRSIVQWRSTTGPSGFISGETVQITLA